MTWYNFNHMKIKKIALCCLGIATFALNATAARIDTLSVQSPKMKKEIEVVVVVPEQVLQGKACPTLYLLHGYGGNAHTWLGIKPELPEMADRDGIIIVCPDGQNSWYWDSPNQADSQYETFVSSELTGYIDSHYATIKDRKGRAIAGLSMGGHGGMWLSIRHKDLFGAGGSTSGGMDIRPFPNNWEMKKQLGEKAQNQKIWDEHTVMTQLDKIQNGDLALIIDCGSEDFFLEVNKKFHKELDKRGIFHDFIVRPGKHSNTYWNNSIDYQWTFFKKFFSGYRNTGE